MGCFGILERAKETAVPVEGWCAPRLELYSEQIKHHVKLHQIQQSSKLVYSTPLAGRAYKITALQICPEWWRTRGNLNQKRVSAF